MSGFDTSGTSKNENSSKDLVGHSWDEKNTAKNFVYLVYRQRYGCLFTFYRKIPGEKLG